MCLWLWFINECLVWLVVGGEVLVFCYLELFDLLINIVFVCDMVIILIKFSYIKSVDF